MLLNNRLFVIIQSCRVPNKINHLTTSFSLQNFPWDRFGTRLPKIASICLACSVRWLGARWAYLRTISMLSHALISVLRLQHGVTRQNASSLWPMRPDEILPLTVNTRCLFRPELYTLTWPFRIDTRFPARWIFWISVSQARMMIFIENVWEIIMAPDSGARQAIPAKYLRPLISTCHLLSGDSK